MNRNQQPTVARRTERLVVRQFDDETVVYDLSTERVTALDAATAAVWSAAEQPATLSDIAASTGQSEEDVAAALVKLDGADLLQDSGVSRRLLLKRIGLVTAGVVALPVVTAAPAWAACSGQTRAIAVGTQTCGTDGRKTVNFSISGFPVGTYTVTLRDGAGDKAAIFGMTTVTVMTDCAATAGSVTTTAPFAVAVADARLRSGIVVSTKFDLTACPQPSPS